MTPDSVQGLLTRSYVIAMREWDPETETSLLERLPHNPAYIYGLRSFEKLFEVGNVGVAEQIILRSSVADVLRFILRRGDLRVPFLELMIEGVNFLYTEMSGALPGSVPSEEGVLLFENECRAKMAEILKGKTLDFCLFLLVFGNHWPN